MSRERPALADARTWLVAESAYSSLSSGTVLLGQSMAGAALLPFAGLPLVFVLAFALAAATRVSLIRSTPGTLARAPASVPWSLPDLGPAAASLTGLDTLLLTADLLQQDAAQWLRAATPRGQRAARIGLRERLRRLQRLARFSRPVSMAAGQGVGPRSPSSRTQDGDASKVSAGPGRPWRRFALVRRWPFASATPAQPVTAAPSVPVPLALPRVTGPGVFVVLGAKGDASVLAPGAAGTYEVMAREHGLRALAVRGLAVQARVPLVEHAGLAGRIGQLATPAPVPLECTLEVMQMAQWLKGAAAMPARMLP
jgi:hypothetical protein